MGIVRVRMMIRRGMRITIKGMRIMLGMGRVTLNRMSIVRVGMMIRRGNENNYKGNENYDGNGEDNIK
jgi:hypothetical protein